MFVVFNLNLENDMVVYGGREGGEVGERVFR